MKLKVLELKGFKSIDNEEGQQILFGDITILLGANGSGKSNIVSFFKMLGYMMSGGLQAFVGKYGASRLLFFGPKKTESIHAKLHFTGDEAEDSYEIKLSHGLPDRLFVSGEVGTFHKHGFNQPQTVHLAAGGAEVSIDKDPRPLCKHIYPLLSNIRTYQFHDTSESAKIKDRGYIDDAKYLRSDGGNLAAFLKMLKDDVDHRRYYDRIVRHIQRMMPQFGDFSLDTLHGNDNYVRLNWTDASGDGYLFGPDQLSDGSLRFMALTTLLLQPPRLLPSFIVLDEPELGLHPSAISELAGMIRSVCRQTQILLATQSTRLADEFSLADLVVVERDEQRRCSKFSKPDPEELKEWMERYSLSELWEKNVIGGQP